MRGAGQAIPFGFCGPVAFIGYAKMYFRVTTIIKGNNQRVNYFELREEYVILSP